MTSSATSNYAYASSSGDYRAVPIKSGQIQRISAMVIDHYNEQPVSIRKCLSEELAPELTSYIEVQSYYDPYTGNTEHTGTICVVPLDTSACILNDQYTYCNQHFTQAEIDYAIAQTCPERFI